MINLATKIQKIRKSNNLNQSEFGARLGINRSYVSQIETGSATPSKQLIKLISREFLVREEWLLGTRKKKDSPASMKEFDRFEYRIYEFEKGRPFFWSDSSQVQELNALGKEGWEAIAIEGMYCFLKRKLT